MFGSNWNNSSNTSTFNWNLNNESSQFFGNFYLSYFDHWIKETKQRKYYFRYMDDVVILSDNKNDLRDLFNEIETYLNENLKLNIKKNYQIFPLERGIDFLGYRIFKNYTLLRKNICKRFIQKALKYRELQTEKLMCSLASYKGWLKWCNSHNLQTKYLKVA